MTTLARLTTKLERLQQAPLFQPRLHVFVLEAGQELSAEQEAMIRPGDQVIIEETPVGYFGLEDKQP